MTWAGPFSFWCRMDIAQLALTVNSTQIQQASRAMDSFSMSLRNVTTTSNLQTTRAMEGLATSLKNVTKAAAALTAAANSAGKGGGAAATSKPGAGADAAKAVPAATGAAASAAAKAAAAGTDKAQADDKDKAKKRPLQAYADAHDKTPADDVNAAVASAFPELEKQLIGLSTTGKANFDALGKQLLAGLSRVAIEDVVTRPLATAMDGWIKDLFGNYAPDKKDDKKDADSVSGAAAAAGVNSVTGAAKDGKSKDGDATKDEKDKIETLQDYIKSVGTTSDEINKAFGKTFTSMEDQLVTFVTTGKANFKSLADSIIADLARVAVRQGLSSLGSGLLSLFGGAAGGSASGLSVLEGSAGMGDASSVAAMSFNAYTGGYIKQFATGGYTGDGGKYEPKAVVHGGEYVFDKDSTQRLGVSYLEGLRAGAPTDAGGAGAIILQPATAAGGININTNITVAGANGDASDGTGDGGANDARQLGTLINQQVRSVLVQESRQGGVLWNIRNGYGN